MTAALVPFEPAHASSLMSWLGSAEECLRWGGPRFRYPFDQRSFLADLHWKQQPAWCLVGDDSLLAFGQYYLRQKHLHLARLCVAPQHRRRGYGAQLIEELCRQGFAQYGRRPQSLFVLPSNVEAIHLYRRLGFVDSDYVAESPLGIEVVFMRRRLM